MEAKVLVMEENQEIATLIRSCLAMSGIRCTLCATGACGLSTVAREQHDALILDVDSPLSDGRAFIAGLNSAGRLRVIILTTWNFAGDLALWWDMSVDGVITKPFPSRFSRNACRKCSVGHTHDR